MHTNTRWLTGHGPRPQPYDLQREAEAKDDAVTMYASNVRRDKYVNLTPHQITLCGMTIAPTAPAARVEVKKYRIDVLGYGVSGTVPVLRSHFGDVLDLPAPVPGTVYIVSRLVVEAAPKRHDIYFPELLIRDSEGRIIGAEALGRI